jgi:glutaminase
MGESALPVELGRLARAGRLDQLEHLARYGGDMDAADEDGRTCLHLAAAYGHKHIVEFLANLGQERVSPNPNPNLNP